MQYKNANIKLKKYINPFKNFADLNVDKPLKNLLEYHLSFKKNLDILDEDKIFKVMSSLNKTFVPTGIVINLKQNNIFCTIKSYKEQHVIKQTSASKCALKVTKKTLKFMSKQFLWLFFTKVFKGRFKNFIVIKIISPAFLRVSLSTFLLRRFNNLKHLIIFDNKKCFNGCRAKKIRRKKRRKKISLKI